jgi:hypothetical protein
MYRSAHWPTILILLLLLIPIPFLIFILLLLLLDVVRHKCQNPSPFAEKSRPAARSELLLKRHNATKLRPLLSPPEYNALGIS